jgi:hypothetical protein
MAKNEACQSGTILNLLKGMRTWTEKKKFIEEVIESCGQGGGGSKTGKKGKRPMSAWNCYLKMCSKKNNGKNFGACMNDKDLKQKEYTPNKDFYAFEAGEGCDGTAK